MPLKENIAPRGAKKKKGWPCTVPCVCGSCIENIGRPHFQIQQFCRGWSSSDSMLLHQRVLFPFRLFKNGSCWFGFTGWTRSNGSFPVLVWLQRQPEKIRKGLNTALESTLWHNYYPRAQNQYVQEKNLGELIFARMHAGPIFALARIQVQENIFLGGISRVVWQILRGIHPVRIHAAPVFALARIQENIPGKLFMYWSRARGTYSILFWNCYFAMFLRKRF